MRRPSRRSVVASAVLGVALVAGATVAYATRDRGSTSALAPLDTPREVVPEQPVHSPSPTPKPATSSPASARPTATRTTSPPADETAFGPRLPGSVVAPYRPGQTSWDATSNGFRFHVSTTPGKQGAPMTWTVDVKNARSGCCAIYVVWDDGFSDISHATCDAPAAHLSTTHIFNRARRHDFVVQVNDKAHCGNGRDGALYGSFDVTAGTTTAQGPALPVVQFDWSSPVAGHEGDTSYVSLWGEVREEDGWITKLVVTFGDGTSKTYGGDTNPEGCHRGPDGWPTGSLASLPAEPPDYHHYAKPGIYTLTLTGYSAGCDGSMVQQGSKSFTWEVEG